MQRITIVTFFLTILFASQSTLLHAEVEFSPKFEEVADGIFVHQGDIAKFEPGHFGDISNSAFIVGDEKVLMIDSSGSRQAGDALYKALREITDLPVAGLVLTHMHPDHIYGATAFSAQGIDIFGHPNLSQAIAERRESYSASYLGQIGEADAEGSELPEEIMALMDGYTFDLGNRKVHVKIWQTAHTNNDLTLYDQNTKTLIAGDLLFDHHIPVIDGSIRGWQSVLEEIERMDVAQIVPGHGDISLPFPEGFEPQESYFDVLIKDTQNALNDGTRLSEAVKEIGQSERENWEVFDAYNPRNATTVFSELEWE